MFSSINETFGCCSKIFGCRNKKKIFVVPNFVAVTKPFFSVHTQQAKRQPSESRGKSPDENLVKKSERTRSRYSRVSRPP